MTAPWTRVEQLAPHHDIETFRSGRNTVDTWLHENARKCTHTVATYLCLDEAGTVLAFFALTPIIVSTTGFPGSLRRGTNSQGMSTAVLLAQMGVVESEQGHGHGATVFRRAAREAAVAHGVLRVPLLVVDAADESLVEFYKKLGMRPLPNSSRLCARLDKIGVQTSG